MPYQTQIITNNNKTSIKDGVVSIIKKDENFLLIKQNKQPYNGFWGPIHGTIEHGESEKEAVIRETFEEVGLIVKPLKKLWASKADYKTNALHWWRCVTENYDNIQIDTTEISEYGFFSIKMIMQLRLMPATRYFFLNIV